MDNFWQQLDTPIFALAPMAGVTDIAFRQMCKLYGADVLYTEFASADALIYESQKTLDMIKFQEEERPVVVQIFGNSPEHLSKAAKVCEELGFDGIDLNFGCPAYKVVKTGGGVSLMRDPHACRELIQATIEAVNIPVSIKIRSSISAEPNKKQKTKNNFLPQISEEKIAELGQQDIELTEDSVTAVEFVKNLKGLDIAAIMIHARSYEKPFDGYPQLGIVKEVRKIYDGVLIHNGGVYTPEIAKEMLEATQADGIGTARGAWGRPWIFKQMKDYIATGSYHTPDIPEIKQIIIEHARRAFEQKGPHGIIEFRKHLSWYIKGWPEAKKLRSELMQANELGAIINILQ